ncbi:response regulator [Desulfovibrio sp. JY]|nr:response regulator [Desulfovibrio sp. JY]
MRRESEAGRLIVFGSRGWIDLHLYAMASVAILSGVLLWWTNASWRENFAFYPPIVERLRQARADIVRGYLAVERHLAGEPDIRLADADAFFEQAAQSVADIQVKLRAVAARSEFSDGLAQFELRLGDYHQEILRFEALSRASLKAVVARKGYYGVERQASYAAMEKLADAIDAVLDKRIATVARQRDRINRVLFFVWLSFLAFLAVSLALAGARRRKAEKALIESEGKYRLLFDQVMDVILLVDEQTGRILDCNQAVATEWGFDREEIIGKNPSRLRLPPDGSATEVRYANGRRAVLRETRLVTRLGEVRMASVRTGFFSFGGRQVRLDIFRDVTERNKDDTALKERAAMLRGLGDNLPDGVIYKYELLADRTRRFLYVSQGVERLFHVTVPEALADASSVLSRIEPEGLDALRHAEMRAMDNLAVIDVQARFTDGQGTLRWGQFRAAPRRTAAGGVIFDGLLFDVTGQKRTEESLRLAKSEAEAASLAKSEFLANISHEVRTPLNGVLGMLQLLETSRLSAEDASHVATALACGRGLVRVLADILDFSLIEAGRLVLRRDACDIRSVIADVFGVLSLECEKRGLCATFDVAGDVPAFVATDAARLRQILFNVVGNAVKFTPYGTVHLHVSLASRRGEETHLLFAVRDTGIGIPEDRMEAIFEPFTQIDGSLTRKYGGTGLGLGIVKRLVGLLDGHITVESQPGGGTEFAFTIRCRETAPPAPKAAPPRDEAGATAPARVLVVEDEAINRMATVSMLGKLGFDASAVTDGDEALDALAAGDYDVVLMDIQMPRLSGDEATRRIRRGDTPGVDPLIPIIALTAHAMDGDKDRYLACGMNDYLSKPVDITALGRAVARAATLRRAITEMN